MFAFRIHVYEIYNPGGLASSILAGDWLFNIICSMFVNKCQHCYEFFFWGNNSSTTFLFDVLKTKLSHESHKKKVAIYACKFVSLQDQIRNSTFIKIPHFGVKTFDIESVPIQSAYKICVKGNKGGKAHFLDLF